MHFVASPLAVVTMAWGAQAWALKLSLVGQALFVAALAAGLALGGLNARGLGRVGGDEPVLRLVLLEAGHLAGDGGCGAMSTTWLRAELNRLRRRIARVLLFRMLFGEPSQGRLLPHTRISPASCIEHEDRLTLGDHVYIGPFNFIEASGGITLDEGVQITSHVSIVTHSSHRAMRLLGREYVAWSRRASRAGWPGRCTSAPTASSARMR